VVAGDESASADFHVGQMAAAHLVVQQVAGQAGQPGGFVDGIGQPVGLDWFRIAWLICAVRHGTTAFPLPSLLVT